mgnify:CR=1 FL=1
MRLVIIFLLTLSLLFQTTNENHLVNDIELLRRDRMLLRDSIVKLLTDIEKYKDDYKYLKKRKLNNKIQCHQ